MIVCKTFKDFIKVYRKNYRKYFHRHHHSAWTPWIQYDIYTKEQVDECKKHKKWCDKNLHSILDDFLNDKDLFVKFIKVGKLIGVQVTNEDYYWIYVTEDGKKHLASCVGKYQLINNNEEG